MNPTNHTSTTPNPTNATPPPSESSGALNITPGKFYRTRDGSKARVYITDAGGDYPVHGAVFDGTKWLIMTWTILGKHVNGAGQRGADLIAEWSDKPEIDWSAMPAWAVAVAMDEDKSWMWYTKVPVVEFDDWCPAGMDWEGDTIPAAYAPKWSGDWRDSLVVRPEGGAK